MLEKALVVPTTNDVVRLQAEGVIGHVGHGGVHHLI